MIKNTSLCYIERDGCYLMLHRIKKENDANEGKWIGIGGKFEPGETPEQCCRREVMEETGLTLSELTYRGIVDFVSDCWAEEIMHLFSARIADDAGITTDCSEGVLEWIPIEKVTDLPQWEGDREFLRLMQQGAPFFSMKLTYCGEKLVGTEYS